MRSEKESKLSIVLPCRNEAAGLQSLLPKLRALFPNTEVLVVDDGSVDDSGLIAKRYGACVVAHPYAMGNGAAIKSGARNACGATLVFLDADGQHDPAEIPRMLEKLDAGYDMVVGARAPHSHANVFRRVANRFYNFLASAMTGHQVEDLTSGFRAVRARHFRKFLYLLPNGFSYPTTITMAFFRSGLPVAYVPIVSAERTGKSHIKVVRDGVRFFVIILKIGALFSPMRLFLPISATLFTLGLGYYAYTFFNFGRFTNMSALVMLSALLTFLIGLLAEQISSLHYKGMDEDVRRLRR